jgi:glycosyltransferase involved in cell wall biosynthesis
MNATHKAIWISWHRHPRTAGLCAAWGLNHRLVEKRGSGAPARIGQAWRTLVLLRRERPTILFIENPSLGLASLAACLKGLFRYKLVVDAHNEAIRPILRSGAFIQWLSRRLLRVADITIVTNRWLAADVSASDGLPVVLPDPLPRMPAPPASQLRGGVVVISTFAADEPIDRVFRAAAELPALAFFVTGRAENCRVPASERPPNVILTGYLDDLEYWRLLAGATAVVDLTTMDDCLVCGGYEALAAGKSLVLSDNRASRELFGEIAEFCDNSTEGITRAIARAVAGRVDRENAARIHSDRYRGRWDALSGDIRAQIMGRDP